MFVLRGTPRGARRLVFLHGMCGHGLGYAQAFAFSAAKLGTLIAPQADVSCGGGLSKWSNDVTGLDARITRTFRELNDPDPEGEITVIGMSQGATRAAQLVKLQPRRYTRLISIAAPTAIAPGQLPTLFGAVMMAGERDRQDLMRQSARALAATRVPSTFMLIPNAAHGDLGRTPEQTMARALEWVLAQGTTAASGKP
jgi:pimeloyl-ACP methyl ester carboxylesterase